MAATPEETRAHEMLRRFVWKEGAVASFRLKEDLFTVGQLLRNPYLAFFYVSSVDGKFAGVDLGEVPELFTVPVARDFLQRRAWAKVRSGVAPKQGLELPELWIRPRTARQGNYPWRGGDLVRIDPHVGDLGMDNELVQADIDPADQEVLSKHEMTNIWTDKVLVPRLILCLKQKKNIDPLKMKIFFGQDPYGIID